MSGVALPDVVPTALHLLTCGSLRSKMTVNSLALLIESLSSSSTV